MESSNFSSDWTLEERLNAIHLLTDHVLKLLSQGKTDSLVPYRNLELAYILSHRPAEQLQGRRKEILRAIDECELAQGH